MQVLVTGMHRSGTSVVARLLAKCGCYFGREEDLMPPKPDNPGGFWEHLEAYEINVGILDAANVAWDTAIGGETDQISQAERTEAGARINDFVAEMMRHELWAVKDPRLALTFPFWRPLLSEPIILWCVRNPIEIGVSLKGRNGFPTDLGIALWEAYTLQAMRVFAGTPVVVASFDGLLRDPISEVKRLVDSVNSLGRGTIQVPSDSEIESVIQKNLHRSVTSPDQEAQFLTDPRRRLWELSLTAEGWSGQSEIPELSDLSREEILHHRHLQQAEDQPVTVSGAEVVERLAGIEAGLRDRWTVVDDGLKALNRRCDAILKVADAGDRLTEIETGMNDRWSVIDGGLKGLNQRCDLIHETADAGDRLTEIESGMNDRWTVIDVGLKALMQRCESISETADVGERLTEIESGMNDRWTVIDDGLKALMQLCDSIRETADVGERIEGIETGLIDRWKVLDDGLRALMERCDLILEIAEAQPKRTTEELSELRAQVTQMPKAVSAEFERMEHQLTKTSSASARDLSRLEARLVDMSDSSKDALGSLDARLNEILRDRDEKEQAERTELNKQLSRLTDERESMVAELDERDRRLQRVANELEHHQDVLAGYRSSLGGRMLERWWRLRSKG